ncbi:MAG TPA: sensor domain-containing protein, partial [Trueperaceae bacterium]|nr:sensor domain-containing protein [Trueperaceae bacterium]
MTNHTTREPLTVYSEHSEPEFLYEPEAGASLDHGRDLDSTSTMIRNSGRNLAVLVGMFFVSLAAFIVGVTLFSLGVSLAVLMVGLFILVGCLMAAGGTARVTKSMLAYAGADLPQTVYPPTGSGFGVLRRLRDPQSWRDLLYIPIAFVLSTFSFS